MKRFLALAAVPVLASCGAAEGTYDVSASSPAATERADITSFEADFTGTKPKRPVAVTPPPAPARARASRATTRPRPTRAALNATDDVWMALARCESGGNPRAVGGGGRYFGAFQFSLSTWHSLGYSGNPVDYPFEVQLEAAKRLQARSGWGQWPACSRELGLR